jgi:aminocarboxymuconate-semialdehyde decarboxylase
MEHVGKGCARMMIGDTVFREVGENLWHPPLRVEEADRDGVDVQVLSTVPVMFSYWAKVEHALDLSRMLNDHIASVVRDHPTRFAGLGTIPLQDPDVAARELERCMRELGLSGVEIGTNVGGANLDDPSLRPVFETAERLGAAVFVHPWEVLGRDRMAKYWLPWLVGMPAETSLAICSVIFGGVLERFPKLRIAFAHGGGSFAGTFGRIERGFDERPDLVAVDNATHPRDYLGRFYVDSLVHDAATLRYLVALVGPNRVALGSDYPFPLGERVPGRLIESVEEFSDETKQRLLAGTAAELLGIPAR